MSKSVVLVIVISGLFDYKDGADDPSPDFLNISAHRSADRAADRSAHRSADSSLSCFFIFLTYDYMNFLPLTQAHRCFDERNVS
jgi:hypothetical protein